MSLDVSLAIDGDAAAAALAPHVPGLERCTPRHVRYKPGRRAVLRYRNGERVVYGKRGGAPGPEALLFGAAALVRWSSLPFRALEPDWPAAIEQRLELADRCLTGYRRRSVSTGSH